MGDGNKQNKTEELRELSQPESEEVIASIQTEEGVKILKRWVPKINSMGERKQKNGKQDTTG